MNPLYGQSAIRSVKTELSNINSERTLKFLWIQSGVTTDLPVDSSGFAILFSYNDVNAVMYTFHNTGDIYSINKSNNILGDFIKI